MCNLRCNASVVPIDNSFIHPFLSYNTEWTPLKVMHLCGFVSLITQMFVQFVHWLTKEFFISLTACHHSCIVGLKAKYPWYLGISAVALPVPTMEANHPFHRSICMNCKIQTRYEKPLKFLSVRSKIVTQSQPAFHYKLNIFWAKRHLSLFRSILISCSQLLLEYKWFQIIPNL